MGAPPARLAISERSFQSSVVDYARLNGWRVFHVFDSRRSEAGYPDLTLVRGGELVFAELKTDLGRLTPEQRDWLEALADAGATIRVWRPADWDQIVEELRRRR